MHNKKIAPLPGEKNPLVTPIKSMGVVLDEEGLEVKDKFLKFQADLQMEGSEVEIMACLPKKHRVTRFEGVIFTPAEISWLGKIKANEVKEFLMRPFDLLLMYHREDAKTIRLVATKSAARLKVGRQQEGFQAYDLEISTKFEEVDVFLAEAKKYLKVIKKID